MGQDLLLRVNELQTHFFTDEGTVRAVNGVSFEVHEGRTLGVVGESGCGKSVTAQSIMQIVPSPGRIVSGNVFYYPNRADEPVDLASTDPAGERIRSIRGKDIAMIFQEPMRSLSPVHTIGNQIMETIMLHQEVTKKEAYAQAIEILQKVGIPDPHRLINEYPYQLSGGMQQRAMIAIALCCNPRLLIADEPTTALDVTVQAQILGLMRTLQAEVGMAIMIITHDLGVVAEMADEVIVMYMGLVVEQADVNTIFDNPRHPYTQGLLRSIPRLNTPQRTALEMIEGSVPSPYEHIEGCPFYPRCAQAKDESCSSTTRPDVIEISNGHFVRCFLYDGVMSNA